MLKIENGQAVTQATVLEAHEAQAAAGKRLKAAQKAVEKAKAEYMEATRVYTVVYGAVMYGQGVVKL